MVAFEDRLVFADAQMSIGIFLRNVPAADRSVMLDHAATERLDSRTIGAAYDPFVFSNRRGSRRWSSLMSMKSLLSSVCLLVLLPLSAVRCDALNPPVPGRESPVPRAPSPEPSVPGSGSGSGSTGAPAEAPAPAPAPGEPFRTQVPPMFWSWQEPLGRAKDHPRIIGMVIDLCGRSTPEASADRMIAEILRRGLGPGEVCLLPQHFGMGHGDPSHGNRTMMQAPALFRHWCDGVMHRERQIPGSTCERIGVEDAAQEWWMTPWMRHGIDSSRQWMQRFIARYRAEQLRNPRIPDPVRFHFDSEWWVIPHFSPRGALEAFRAMQDDPRWTTEAIPGYGGKTMAELYEEAGRPNFNAEQSWWLPVNRAWTIWYAELCMTAADAAMHEAAYVPVKAAWPNVLCSNYQTSASADGKGNPPRLTPPARPTHHWFRHGGRGFADLQSPYIYWASGDFASDDDPLEQVTMRRSRLVLDNSMHSFGGPHRNIVPWMEVLGCTRTRRTGEVTMTPTLFRDQLALCRGRGIDEIILWSDSSTQQNDLHWNHAVRVLQQVWDAHLESHRVFAGSVVGADDTDLLRFAERAALRVTSVPQDAGAPGAAHRVVVTARFRATAPETAFGPRIAIRAEILGVPPDAEVRVATTDHNGMLFRKPGDPEPGRLTGKAVLPAPQREPGSRILDVTFEISARSPFTAAIDLLQCYGTDEPPDS